MKAVGSTSDAFHGRKGPSIARVQREQACVYRNVFILLNDVVKNLAIYNTSTAATLATCDFCTYFLWEQINFSTRSIGFAMEFTLSD
jgi:hypothetical protein